MDTQRLILFVIFSFSALFLWEAWQRDHRPPVPQTTSRRAGTESRDRRAAAERRRRRPAVPGSSPAAVPAGEKIVIKTDLFVANVDTVGGVLTQLALNAHRDTHDESKPYVLLQQNADRTFIAQSGLLGEGMPNHRTLWQALPGPRELAPGTDTLELKLQATTASGDKVVQTLTFHRGSYVIDVTYQIMNAGSGADRAVRILSVRRATPRRRMCKARWRPRRTPGPVIYNETDKFKKVEPRRTGQAGRRPGAQAAVHQEHGQRLGGDDRALLSRRVAAVRQPEVSARVLREEARQRPVRRRRDPAGGRRSRRAPPARSRFHSTSDRRSRTRSRNSRPVSISSSTTAFSRSSRRRCSGC